jgi:hypothetical protein
MQVAEVGGYRVGQHGWIDVLENPESRVFQVQGEIVRLIPTTDYAAWALIRTGMGLGAYRVW